MKTSLLNHHKLLNVSKSASVTVIQFSFGSSGESSTDFCALISIFCTLLYDDSVDEFRIIISPSPTIFILLLQY